MKGTKRAYGTFIPFDIQRGILLRHLSICLFTDRRFVFQSEEVVEANGSFAGANTGGKIEKSGVERAIDGSRRLQSTSDKRFFSFFLFFLSLFILSLFPRNYNIDSRFGTESKDRRAAETIGGERDAEDAILEKIEHVEGTNEKHHRDRRTREINQRSLVAIVKGRVGAG